MTIKVHFIVPLYLLFLSITNVRTELSIGSIPLSWMDVGQHLHRKKQYKVFEWYPIGTAFTSIVESYWKKGRKVRANQLKSQLIKKVEDAFHDFLRTCMKELQSSNIFEFNQKLNDFTRMLCILVAQQREALTITYQRALANGD
uniref:Uncharacterized protein n=1 Tax=Ipomoea trifida TaxID=35884 RepID=A0A902_IPOTF|nr:hypothetical protein [Ipomoea trifida]